MNESSGFASACLTGVLKLTLDISVKSVLKLTSSDDIINCPVSDNFGENVEEISSLSLVFLSFQNCANILIV